jgi:integrase
MYAPGMDTSAGNSPELNGLIARLASELLYDPMRQRIAEQGGRPLAVHLEEYRAGLLNKSNTARHVRDTVRRARVMIRLCRAKLFGELTPAKAQAAIGKIRAERTPRKTLGLSTANHYIRSIKGFAAWMVSDYRAARSPFLSLKPFNTATEIRRQRRALAPDEVKRLIRVTANGPTIAGIPGSERAMMYMLASVTGLRSGEMQSLTRKSFILEGPPHVVVEASYSKHRRRDMVPLVHGVAAVVRAYIEQHPGDNRLFRRPTTGNGSPALKQDLALAEIEYCIDGKYADFHSLRHTFVSSLFDTGCTPKEAQTLARHSDPRLTLSKYAHVAAAALRAAVERLPSTISRPGEMNNAPQPGPLNRAGEP